jgi:hypothetical protein
MPQWAGSCWYYLRFIDPHNNEIFCDPKAEHYWMGTQPTATIQSQDSIAPHSSLTPGVDLYVGGTEHAVLHLLYARFWHKVLFDLGCASTPDGGYSFKLTKMNVDWKMTAYQEGVTLGNVTTAEQQQVSAANAAFQTSFQQALAEANGNLEAPAPANVRQLATELIGLIDSVL